MFAVQRAALERHTVQFQGQTCSMEQPTRLSAVALAPPAPPTRTRWLSDPRSECSSENWKGPNLKGQEETVDH